MTLHRRPPLGLVAWRRNGRTVSAVPRTSYAGVYPSNHFGGPNTLLLSHSSYSRPVFDPEFPCFVPKRRSQRGVVGLRVRVTLTLFHQRTAIYRPNKASDWSILTSLFDIGSLVSRCRHGGSLDLLHYFTPFYWDARPVVTILHICSIIHFGRSSISYSLSSSRHRP